MIHEEIGAGGHPRTSSEIEDDIQRTRSRMDVTLDQLGERLTARSILNSALDWWETRSTSGSTRARVTDTAETLMQQVKDNPMPALLVGAGIAWMIIDAAASEEHGHERRRRSFEGRFRGRELESRRRPAGTTFAREHEGEEEEGPGLLEKAKDKLAEGKEAISEAAETAKSKIAGLGEATQEKAGEMRQRARETYYRGRETSRGMGRSVQAGYTFSAERFEHAMDEYPIALGFGFAALGALVGLILPRTRREDELLGERSDQLVEAAKEKGQELLERGKAVGERVAETAVKEAEKQGITPETAKEKMSELASKAGEVARKTKEEAAAAAKEQKLTPEQMKQEASSATKSTPQQSKTPGEQRRT